MLRICKVKDDGDKVRIEYQRERADKQGYDDYSMSSVDRPTVAFTQALSALSADVVQICELPESDADKLTIRGVSVTWTSDIMGACITALKRLNTANSPLVINTPHLPSEDYGDNDGPVLREETALRLHRLLLEAEGYIDGDRAQPSLLKDADVAAEAQNAEVVTA